MRYIVLYIITILWITTSDAAAQKPAIDLLPSTHRHLHPDAVIDTSSTNDSLVFVVARHPAKIDSDSMEQNNEPSRDSLFPKRNARKVIEYNRPGIVPLMFNSLFPIRILIYNTALNI